MRYYFAVSPASFAPSSPSNALLLLLALLVRLGSSSVYTPDTFPDSQRDWDHCGIDQPALACDPDALLNPASDGRQGIVVLDEALRYLRENTECICDRRLEAERPRPSAAVAPAGEKVVPFGQGMWSTAERCEKGAGKHGFTVSVAVLGKMELRDDQRRRYRAGSHLAAIFAAELKNRLNRGQCNDDSLIVLAVNDSSIRTSTGGMAATKLSPEFIINASIIAQKFFSRRDFTSGLLHMVDQFAVQLGAPARPMPTDWFDRNMWPLFPEALRQSQFRWPILIGFLLLLLLLLILLISLVIRMIRQKKRSAEYIPGREMGRQ